MGHYTHNSGRDPEMGNDEQRDADEWSAATDGSPGNRSRQTK
jgi:hypothetical protein